jgi:hypothetical protein
LTIPGASDSAIQAIRTPGGLRVVLEIGVLDRACALRGWSFAELGRRANISRPTIQAAVLGKPISPLTYLKIRQAFRRFDLDPSQ